MKTVTMRIDDSVYQMIKIASDGQKRNISSFIEFATMQYLTSPQYIDDNEMKEILNNEQLADNLELGIKEVKNENYMIV